MKMVVYREYTDVTFDIEKTRDSSETHLGLLGPIIRVEVGDIVEVVFKNKASRPFSLHAHGLMYDKLNEGFLYQDGTSTKVDDAVSPGGYHVYKWTVPERSGPDKHDPNCITWPYFSATNPVRDTETGLIGPIIVCRKGTLDSHGKRSDVDKEFVLFFSVMTEENNWFGTGDSMEYVVNGYINGNAKGFLMNMYDKVAWYVFSFGSEEDIHSIHFHGQTMIHKDGHSHRVDVIDVFPGSSDTAEMIADNPGTWLLHCHVNDHLRNGMETTFTVNEAGKLLIIYIETIMTC